MKRTITERVRWNVGASPSLGAVGSEAWVLLSSNCVSSSSLRSFADAAGDVRRARIRSRQRDEEVKEVLKGKQLACDCGGRLGWRERRLEGKFSTEISCWVGVRERGEREGQFVTHSCHRHSSLLLLLLLRFLREFA